MASKWFEVKIQAWKTVVVEVPDDWQPERDRQELAQEHAAEESFPCINCEVDGRKTRRLETSEDIESAKRHADEVFAA